MKIKAAWRGSKSEPLRLEYELVYYPKGLFSLDSQVNYLKSFKHLEDWTIVDAKDNSILASKNPIDKKDLAIELYKEHNNYAKVARILDVHPTTVRTWCKE